MRKFVIISLIVMPFLLGAQTISSLVAYGSDQGTSDGYGGYQEDARSVAVDAAGNMYVVGCYYDTTYFGATRKISHEPFASFFVQNGYLAKFNSSGTLLWVDTMLCSSILWPSAVSISGSGASALIYVSGRISSGTGSFGALTATCVGSSDAFIAQYDANGNEQWVQNIGGTSIDYQEYQALASDAIGNVYVGGVFNGTCSFGGASPTHSLTSAGSGDAFLVKYDKNGNVKWVLGGYNTSGYAHSYALALSPDEANIYVTGYYSSSTLSWGAYSITRLGTSCTFLVDVDSNGTAQWLQRGRSSGYTIATSIDVDDGGDIYISGRTNYSAYFGALPATGITTSGKYDVFLVKYNSSGTAQWSTLALRGTQNKSPRGLGVSAPSGSKNLMITGYFYGTATFGTSIPLTAYGGATSNRDAFIASYNGYNGDVNWAIQGGSTGDKEQGGDVFVVPTWDAYFVGNFEGTATFGGTDIVTSAGNVDMYIGKMSLSYLPISLLDFQARPDDAGDKVELTWVTATETNNDYFTIERSTDGASFEEILQVSGAGNSSVVRSYIAYDDDPIQGQSYYRLKQTDFDGAFSYSSIVSVFIGTRRRYSFILLPNPSKSNGLLKMQSNELPDGEIVIMIYDSMGRLIYSDRRYNDAFNQGNTNIDLASVSGLSKGTYYVTLSGKGFSETNPLVIN